MGGKTDIEWTDATWNPVRGCSMISEGCRRCYAMKQANRQKNGAYKDLVELGPDGPRWTGKIRLVPEVLDQPLHWRKPQRIFVNSMSDLFHEDVPFDFIDEVFITMANAPRHTFQILTKRPVRMLAYVNEWLDWRSEPQGPLRNVWLGVSCEDQKTADDRVPLLLQTPAAVRFVSYEPALEAVDFSKVPGLNKAGSLGQELLKTFWVIVGGESGPKARPFNIEWARSVIRQCRAAQVPCFVKQLGANPFLHFEQSIHREEGRLKIQIEQMEIDTTIRLKDSHGGDWTEWPPDLCVREFPEVAVSQ